MIGEEQGPTVPGRERTLPRETHIHTPYRAGPWMIEAVPLVCLGLVLWLAIAASVAAECPGDCNGDGLVTVSELVTGVAIALGEVPVSDCEALDTNHDDAVSIAELLSAVAGALNGCLSDTPKPNATPAFTYTYSVTGTINGQVAEGRLVLSFVRVGLNTRDFLVDSFTIGSISGSGTAQYFTLGNVLSITVNAVIPGNINVTVSGQARRVAFEQIPYLIKDFTLTGDGYTVTFTATAT